MITVQDDTLQVFFEQPWTLEKHALFIRTKSLPEAQIDFDMEADSYTVKAPARFASLLGLTVKGRKFKPLPLAKHLFDYQAWITKIAFEAKRFAVWSDCGTGKTPIGLEWARQVQNRAGGKVCILAPKQLLDQWCEETEKFYPGGEITLLKLKSREELALWCKGEFKPECKFAVASHHALVAGTMEELRWLSGLILDEASILKAGGGVIKWNLIKSCRGIEYKLALTATPAPNDTMEYASQASFLEKLRNEGEILWTFFHRDPKTQVWRVKPHAKEAFYRFMSAWSIYLRKPSAYGFDDPFANVPEPQIHEWRIKTTDDQVRMSAQFARNADGELIPKQRLGVTARSKLSQLAKGFFYTKSKHVILTPSLKPEKVAELVRAELAAGRQVLVWTVFDAESEILAELLADVPGLATLHGEQSDDARQTILEDFRHGKVQALISKARLLGYGMNFQFCTAMVFSGFDDSFEAWYQAVRRCYRYGSTEQLHVHVPYVPGLEDHIWENILRKKTQWEEDAAIQERNYAEAMKGLLAA
jgi:superfamily II DNA or RNA helicase